MNKKCKNTTVGCKECCFGTLCKNYLFDKQEPLFINSLNRKKKIEKGQPVFSIGERLKYLIAIRTGVVKVFDENKHIKEVLLPGQLAAGEDIFSKNYSSNGVAATNVEVCLLEFERLYDISQVTTLFTSNIIEVIARTTLRKHRMIFVLMQKNISSKVSEFINLLSSIYKESGFDYQDIVLPMSKKELACLLAISESSLSRSLQVLNEQGKITMNKKHICIKIL